MRHFLRPSRRRPLLPAALLLLAGSAAIAPSQAAAAPFTCEASVLRGTIATSPAIEPFVANRGKACANAFAGAPTLGAPLPSVKASALSAVTQSIGTAARPDQQQAIAAGGVADLSLGSLASLGIALPLDQIPLPAIDPITVDISPITGPLNTAAGALTPVTEAIGGVTGALPVPVPTPGLPVALPSTLTIDITAAVRELIKLPSTDLLAIRGAVARAGASCVAGSPVTAGSRSVAGVTVLGNAIDLDTLGDQPIIDTQKIDPSQIDLSKVQIPVVDGLTGGLPTTVLAQVQPLIAAAVAALPPISLPIDLLRVSVRPGTQTKTTTGLTQTALQIQIAALGQSVVDLLVGEAKVGTAGADCKAPAAAAAAPAAAVAGATEAALACTSRRLVLTDVLRKGKRVTITGVADKRFAGRTVTIRFEADGSTAGRAVVASNGAFKTTAKLPSAKLRASNSARYQARLGTERSLNLKLERRMYVDGLTSRSGKVTVRGRVTRPLGAPMQTITLKRRVSCKKNEVVKRFKPKANGTYSVTVDAPSGQTAAVYRLSTRVRKTTRNPKLFPTFTLPRGVDLEQ